VGGEDSTAAVPGLAEPSAISKLPGSENSNSTQLKLEDFLPAQPLQPVRPINTDFADAAAHSGKKLRSRKALAAPHLSRMSANRSTVGWRNPVVAVGLVLGILGVGGWLFLSNSDLRADLGIGQYREMVLVDRYASALQDCQQQLADPQQTLENPERLLSGSLRTLEELFADCIRAKTIPESRHRKLRLAMQQLFSSQLEFKEQAYRVVSSLKGEHRLQFARLTALIALIDVRLQYGLREVPLGTNELDAYCREGILLMRQLDQHFLTARSQGLEQQLGEIATVLDELDQLAVARSRSGVLRGTMPYEYRMMAQASESSHQWCLSIAENQPASQAILQAVRSERTDVWERFELGLSSPNIPSIQIAALDRIHQRAHRAMPSTPSDNMLAAVDEIRPVEAESVTPPSPPSASGTFSPGNFSSGTSPAESIASRQDAVTRPDSALSRSFFGIESGAIGRVADAARSGPSSASAASDSGSLTENVADIDSQGAAERLDFPPPKHTGPSALCIKVQSRRPEWIKEQAAALGQRLGLVPDVQVAGNLLTISFGNYLGNAHDVSKQLKFGVLEIVDGQSRTLFVVD